MIYCASNVMPGAGNTMIDKGSQECPEIGYSSL